MGRHCHCTLHILYTARYANTYLQLSPAYAISGRQQYMSFKGQHIKKRRGNKENKEKWRGEEGRTSMVGAGYSG